MQNDTMMVATQGVKLQMERFVEFQVGIKPTTSMNGSHIL